MSRVFRTFQHVGVCARQSPSSTEFARQTVRRYRECVCVCVCVCASALIANGGKEERRFERFGERKGSCGSGWKGNHGMSVGWRRVQTVLPESRWLISTLFTLAWRQTVRGRRNNIHNGFSANCIREFSKFLYRSTVCKMIIAPATIGKDIINKRSFKEKLFVIHKFNEPIINEIPDIRNEENCKIHLNKLIMEDSTTIHPVPGYIIN